MMFSNLVVALLASALVAPIAAMPHEVTQYQTVHGTSTVSEFSKRQETAIDWSCVYSAGDVNQNRRDAAENIAKYLEGLTAQGIRCGLDHNQAYYNLYTWTIDGQGYEANIYFTGRIPQTVSADYSCSDLARELRLIQERCHDRSGGADSILEWTWLVNCISTPQFSSQPEQPYIEGGVGLEFRESGWPSPVHSQ
ncbi:hypothetical protein DPSP01_010300 [Paraphaeosphaeria sporulosa]